MRAKSNHRITVLFAALVLILTPRSALAGMPSFTITDLARLRLETISFFLLLLFLSAAGVMGLWNLLRRDFVRLPRLNYWRSLGFVALWGLLFLLVLTMISGARELMTPGAWEKRGAIYHVTTQPAVVTAIDRHDHLLALKMALWEYARAHDGDFPASEYDGAIALSAWQSPDITRAHYVYIPGRKADAGAAPLAYEPNVFSTPRLVLTSDGKIREMSASELETAIAGRRLP